MSRVCETYIKARDDFRKNRSNIHWILQEAKMMKYFVILCLCLTMGVVLAQDQETTTEKRVARDLNMPQLPNFSEIPEAMADMANKFATGIQNGMKDMLPNVGTMDRGSRRRRSPQENPKPPKPPKFE